MAERLFGEDGETIVSDWFSSEVSRIDDPAFAKLFTDHINLPGVPAADYSHRYVRSDAVELIGGIRFYAHDISRPFVEVVAHSFADKSPMREGLEILRDCVRSEWSLFAPLDLRLRVLSGTINHPAARTAVTIHAARPRDMAPPDGRVRLVPFADPEDAIALVQDRYADVAAHAAELAKNISAADPDDLRAWHQAGQLHAIIAEGPANAESAPVGLLAIAPGRVAWIKGDEVNEEVVMSARGGRGYAASAQAAWAMTIGSNRDQVIVGTIDRLNQASRRSAERAGRPAILEEVFVSLR
ncbi:hypothetical protein [Jannaschia aquimarina]|uniref:Uncharacterized protein n=1 Tax=Jannaschia aquimarina TaxID=935700 RepID=A0A0D1E9Q1_9RHOB|nr:hypothetical protein [Jannaschia aquimarina]KIT14409.1 hypothetical protein jaqu_38830 [Jannaschia aquimarina]SNT44771.1 hypothetical protein SAMN05421775_1298 [Jannaschia aquimarina]